MKKQNVVVAVLVVITLLVFIAAFSGGNQPSQQQPALVPEAPRASITVPAPTLVVSTDMPFASLYTREPSVSDFDSEAERYPRNQ